MSAAEPLLESRYPIEPLEWSDRNGAIALKAKIEAYWRERGHIIECQLIPRHFTPEMRMARYDLRSPLVNGLPPSLVLPSPEQNS